jgi:hypothetical protein
MTSIGSLTLEMPDGADLHRVEFGDNLPEYFGLPSVGVRMPFYRDMRMNLPRVGRLLRQVRLEGVDLISSTPSPIIGRRPLALSVDLIAPACTHTCCSRQHRRS